MISFVATTASFLIAFLGFTHQNAAFASVTEHESSDSAAPVQALSGNMCPRLLSVPSESSLPNKVGNILLGIYAELGCKVYLQPLPARRGVVHFNSGITDGEVMRTQNIEPLYVRPFVRTKQPLLYIEKAIWRVETVEDLTNNPIGYSMGIRWQEIYVENHNSESQFQIFSTPNDLLAAIQNDEVFRFLYSVQGIKEIRNTEALKKPIRLEKVLSRQPAYHYLGVEFTETIDAINRILQKDPIVSTDNE